MSTATRDLWPDDIKVEEMLTPEEILREQARKLEERTNGLLRGEIVKSHHEDRVLLAFEIFSPRCEGRTRLFSATHRLNLEYPVAMHVPVEELPDFLKDRYYRPALSEVINPAGIGVFSSAFNVLGKGEWITNEWLASTPSAFMRLVSKALALGEIKAAVISMLSRATKAAPTSESKA